MRLKSWVLISWARSDGCLFKGWENCTPRKFRGSGFRGWWPKAKTLSLAVVRLPGAAGGSVCHRQGANTGYGGAARMGPRLALVQTKSQCSNNQSQQKQPTASKWVRRWQSNRGREEFCGYRALSQGST